MLRTTFATLRQPRYAALSIVMLVVALGCIGAGTWQIARFDGKVHANDALTGNAHAATVPVRDVLPLVGAPAPDADAVRYRTVTATGTFDPQHQGMVRLRSVGDAEGYYVLTRFATTDGRTLLVVRGFVAGDANGNPPAHVAAPPAGTVTIHARVQTGESKRDQPHGIPAGQLASINPGDQARRLGTPVYDGYVELLAGQPGTARLTALPAPDLSNPAGGAVEPQHFAYIIQWYLFAILALAAPIVMARSERREREPDDVSVDTAPSLSDEQRRAAKLSDRYGRPVH
jgi:cytochrome oxidase assembly protein ShyY1